MGWAHYSLHWDTFTWFSRFGGSGALLIHGFYFASVLHSGFPSCTYILILPKGEPCVNYIAHRIIITGHHAPLF